jgi:hypothetical protein
MVSEQNRIKNDTNLKNKGFIIIDSLFQQNGWKLTQNDFNIISYSVPGNETEFFKIEITDKKIIVSIPVKNSLFQYKTSFTDYFQASEYLEKRFREYIC